MNLYPTTQLKYLNITPLAGTTSAKVTPDSGFTVQRVTIVKQGVANLQLKCGTIETFQTNNVSGVIDFETLFYCPEAITLTTANPAWVGILGMPDDRTDGNLPVFLVSTSTQQTSTSTVSGTSTVQYSVNGISYGDIIIAFFLFLMLAGQFFGGIMNRVFGVKPKIRNTY